MQSKSIEVVTLKDNFLSARAKEDILAGAFLTDLWGCVHKMPTPHTVQVGQDKHVEPQGAMKFTNHCCSPSARFVFSLYDPAHLSDVQEGQSVSWHMVACHDIKKGEDITFDYTTTEYVMDKPFECTCGSADRCLGTVKGFKFLSPEEQEERVEHLSPVIKEQLCSNTSKGD